MASFQAGISLKKNGASAGLQLVLISTPTRVDSVLVSSAFLGWPFAIFKVFAAALMGLVGGFLVEGLDEETTEPPQQSSPTMKKRPYGKLLGSWCTINSWDLEMVDCWCHIVSDT